MAGDSSVVPGFDLREYLRVLRRRWWVIILAVLVVAGTVAARAFSEEKVYQAGGSIVLSDEEAGDDSALETQIRILGSGAIGDSVRKALPGAGGVAAIRAGQSRVIEVISESTDPRLAQQTVNVYMEEFLRFKRQQAAENLLASGRELQARHDELQKDIDALATEYARTLGDIVRRNAPRGSDSPEQARIRQATLEQERDALGQAIESRRGALVSQQIILEQELREARTANALSGRGTRILNPATLPTVPVRPKPMSDATSGIGIGLLLGIAVAFLLEYLDDSVKGPEDVERVAGGGVPILATIPSASSWRHRNEPYVVSLEERHSPAAEAYRSLRAAVHFLRLERELSVIHFTSPSTGDGKTTTAVNLAVAAALAGQRVILADADLRRPRVHRFFGLRNDVGLTSVLLGDAPLDDALQRIPAVDRLYVLPSGPIPPNPSELLASQRLNQIITTLRQNDALLILDSPPATVADPAVLARFADGVVLVVGASSSTRRQIKRAVDRLRLVDAPIMGAVLNEFAEEGLDHTYQLPPEPAEKGRRARREARKNGTTPEPEVVRR